MRIQESIIGNSSTLTEALEHVSRLAGINRPVLVIGERGTGKELAAQRIHYLSDRWEAPLIKVNCAAIADSLLESELFGHEPGAFTGATRTHHGRFERADGGTLFLDELGTMSLRLQEKLLRLVEYGEFERLGGQKTLQVDVRVVAATHADLRALSAKGEFRDDLLDRLSFDVVHLPPLRKREGDIAELAQHFAISLCAELGWSVFPGLTDSALRELEDHPWPGNIRELKNAVERSIFRWGDPETPINAVVTDPFKSPFNTADDAPEQDRESSEHIAPIPDDTEAKDEPDFTEQVAKLERELLQKALSHNGNNQRRTAEALGLTYDQVRGLVRKHRLSSRKR